MATDHWALLISFLAFISSIALPIYLFNQDKKEKLEIEKKKFYQSALSVKSTIFTTKIEVMAFCKIEKTKEESNKLLELLSNFEKGIDDLIEKSERTNCHEIYSGINGMYKCLAIIEAGITDNQKLITYIKEQSNH